jgi:energy-coupling factor transporter ATP-binding protein EcfA2
MNTEITLNEFATLVEQVGSTTTVLGMGEPGAGKSSVLKMLAARMPTHKPVYLDAALIDLGDIQMPKVSDESVRFIPNSMFVSDQPVILMLDEIGKAMRPVQNALLPLMLERRVGTHQLPEGSIVFATTNLATDGVGDAVQAHARNRMCVVNIKKPDAGFDDNGGITPDGWAHWAIENDIDPALLAWVKSTPECLVSYTDAANDDNPYIFNPKKNRAAFVSPRSLEKASNILKKRIFLTPDTLIGALAGTVGESAARNMQAFLTIADALPDWTRIVKTPESAPVPENPIAQQMLVLGALSRLSKDNVNPWLVYMERLMKEVQALFASGVMRSSKVSLVVTNKKFTDWAVRHSFLY